MAITAQTSFIDVTNRRSSFHTGELAKISVKAIFQARSTAKSQFVLDHLERRDRTVLLLLDGRRTIEDVTRLLHRSELEVAHTLVHLLKHGYIDYMGT